MIVAAGKIILTNPCWQFGNNDIIAMTSKDVSMGLGLMHSPTQLHLSNKVK